MAFVKVKAIEVGFKGGRRYRVGEKFRVAAEYVDGKLKLAKWYVLDTPDKEPEVPTHGPKPARALKPELSGKTIDVKAEPEAPKEIPEETKDNDLSQLM